MSFGFIVKKNTEAGGLRSTAGDTTAIFPPGTEWTDSSTGYKYEYLKNVAGAALVALCPARIDSSSTAGDGQSVVAVGTGAGYVRLRLPMSAVADDSFGWFMKEGRATVTIDCVDQDATDTFGAGDGVIVVAGILDGRTHAITDMDE